MGDGQLWTASTDGEVACWDISGPGYFSSQPVNAGQPSTEHQGGSCAALRSSKGAAAGAEAGGEGLQGLTGLPWASSSGSSRTSWDVDLQVGCLILRICDCLMQIV